MKNTGRQGGCCTFVLHAREPGWVSRSGRAPLGRLARRIRDNGLARDEATAAAHGWHTQHGPAGIRIYRDPRFDGIALAGAEISPRAVR